MEVEALGKHPGETTALKVDLQERQQLTAHPVLHQRGLKHLGTRDLVVSDQHVP